MLDRLPGGSAEIGRFSQTLKESGGVAFGDSLAKVRLPRKMIVHTGSLDTDRIGNVACAEAIEAEAADHGFGNIENLFAFVGVVHRVCGAPSLTNVR